MFWCETDMIILVRLDGVLCKKKRIFSFNIFISGGHEAESVGLYPFCCWDFRLECHRGNGYLSLVCVMCPQVRCHQLTKGVLQSVACLIVIMKLRKVGGSAPLANVTPCKKKEKQGLIFHISNHFQVSNIAKSFEICLYMRNLVFSLSRTLH